MPAKLDRPFAGLLFVIPGIVIAWLGLSLVAERRQRAELEGRVAELGESLENALVKNDSFLTHQAELESRLFETSELHQQQMQLVEQLTTRLEADERKPPPPVDTDTARREIQEAAEVRGELNSILELAEVHGLRFQTIGEHRGKELRDVHLLRYDDGVLAGSYFAARCRFEMDRPKRELTIVLDKVVEIWKGRRVESKTKRITSLPERPRLLEKRLGELVMGFGRYPVEKSELPVGDLETRLLWRDRLAQLFDSFQVGARHYRLFALRSVSNGTFGDVELLGYTDKGRLDGRIQAGQMQVWIDTDTDNVELRFFDGFTEGPEGRIGFPDRWYRLPAKGMVRRDVERILTGFVHHFRSIPK